MRSLRYATPALLASLAAVTVTALVISAPPPTYPDGTEAARKAIAGFRLPNNMKAELFAAEPQLFGPVAFCLDEKNRVYVAEQDRFARGAEENRMRGFFLDDDLQIKTLDDRLAMYERWAAAGKFKGGMSWFTEYADQVRLLEDSNGDGQADKSTVFAGPFNGPLDGIGAGIIAREGTVWYTCIPALWRLKDTKGAGTADQKEQLLRGFGVNCAYLGHDLHGLAWGPDGKLYFSVGDRGWHVTSKEGVTTGKPRTGAVFRCNPDGSDFEVVATGLRNPQELAFDQYGNLFADDNNCDKGDHARLVYVVEGGDSGWNMAYQTIPEPYLVGPWHAEQTWHLDQPPQPGQRPSALRPASTLPPSGKIGTGPGGFCFTSGLSLGERYRNRFFMANYTGNGGIESFGVKPQGAGFEVVDYHDFWKQFYATDVEVGYDGKVYVSDHLNIRWEGGSNGGRIYAATDPAHINDPAVVQTKELFAKGFKDVPAAELEKLLAHGDSRVRLRAQFTLADRGKDSVSVFQRALAGTEQLARLHAIWGLGQLAKATTDASAAVAPMLADKDDEVRGQAAKILGDARYAPAGDALVGLLKDAAPRVRFFAAVALSKLKHKAAVGPLFDMLKDNADRDRFVRHAGVMGLLGCADADALQARAADAAAPVRLAVLLAQRRLNDKRLVQFLDDAELDIAAEAARAVHDLPVEEGYPALAKRLERFGSAAVPGEAEPLLRRALDANFRIGGVEEAKAVARVAATPAFGDRLRGEAVAMLGVWHDGGSRDRVTGFWRPYPKRDAAPARAAAEAVMTQLLATTAGKLQTDAVNLVGKLGLKADDGTFAGWVTETGRDVRARAAALRLLAGRKSPELAKVLEPALKDASPKLRAEARDALATVDPARGAEALKAALDADTADVSERQRALEALARIKVPAADGVLDAWAGRLAKREVPAELQLDVLDALRAAPNDARNQAVAAFNAGAAKGDALAAWRVSLAGGDAERGRELFVGHTTAQCIRCHVVGGVGGNAGPDLTKVVERNPQKPREHLLESIVLPNAKIATGFGNVVLTLTSGKVMAGSLQGEDEKSVTLLTPDGQKVTVAKADIEERTAPTSPMPAMDKVLTPRELRDIVEYLATLK